MHLIKKCPSCGKNLRFPLDKGKIMVSCACGHRFTVDPDDKDLYKNASFDLGTGPGKPSDKSGGMRPHRIRRIINACITDILDFKYKIQNFKLLPTREKIRIALIIFIIVVLSAAVLVLILFRPAKPPVDGTMI